MASEDGSVTFPSLPRRINQASLLDFMSMMTLMQRRMDTVMLVPDNQDRPPVQRRVIDRSPSTSRTRDSQTPARRSRTQVRRCRDVDESRSSMRSRSPVRRSSSSEPPPRDGSPANFSAAFDTAENSRDRSLSDDEDEDGSSRKVSSAQYQVFRQAVTSSKGSFKLNPAKSRRTARASLVDLGDGEVTDRVSWLDQPSLTDTMASTAPIAQGLKEDEEVEKTTLSESLNTGSSTFKHLMVKQIFSREPYRLKVHRDAQYISSQASSCWWIQWHETSFFLPDPASHEFGQGGTREESCHLCILSRLNGGVGDRGAFS